MKCFSVHVDLPFKKDSRIAAIFRYVDDFLVLCTTEVDKQNDGCLNAILRSFQQCCMGLTFTYKVPISKTIKYLDLALGFRERHVYRKYQARTGKGFLPFNSEHSKTVKQGVATTALSSSLKKSREHEIARSFDTQVSRLQDAGYPPTRIGLHMRKNMP